MYFWFPSSKNNYNFEGHGAYDNDDIAAKIEDKSWNRMKISERYLHRPWYYKTRSGRITELQIFKQHLT